MRKIASQIAGAAAVVAAVSAGLAYAQTTESPSTSTTTTRTVTPPKSEDLKSNSTASPYGAGGNNGSVYTPAVRSTDIKAGNVSSVEDPAVTTTTTTTTTAATPLPATTPAQTPAPAVTAEPTPAPAATTGGSWNTDGSRAARADRN